MRSSCVGKTPPSKTCSEPPASTGRPEGMGVMALSVTTPVQTALCSGYAMEAFAEYK